MVTVGLLPHICVFGGGLVLLHVVGCVLGKAPVRQVLTVRGRLPGGLKLIHEPKVFSRNLPLNILQLATNLHHTGIVGPMLDAQLCLLLIERAVAGMELLQQCCSEVHVFVLQMGVRGNDQFRISL